MEPIDRRETGQPAPTVAPFPRKRLRIVKLEERIAPKRGGGTKKCGGGSSNDESTISPY